MSDGFPEDRNRQVQKNSVLDQTFLVKLRNGTSSIPESKLVSSYSVRVDARLISQRHSYQFPEKTEIKPKGQIFLTKGKKDRRSDGKNPVLPVLLLPRWKKGLDWT